MLERPRRVVLLIDYDNLQICASRDTPGRDLQLTPVVQLAQKYGTVILARAYAEWNLSTERLAVYKAGIEPAFAPVLRTESDRSGKSLADTVMVAEGMDMLWTLSPEVVVLATSDKDLIPLVRVAKQRGAYVVVLGSDFTAIPLREMADDHITYKQLITDASGRYTTEAGAARQPAALPEPSRRRTTRERNGRETRTAVTTTTVSSPARTETRGTETREPREPREPRETRESRTEREREASAAAAPAATEATPPEPVAPVASGTPGEADGQVGSRRRRRRGSRRRSERVGAGGEGGGELDESSDASDVEGEGEPTAELHVADTVPSPLDPTPIEPAAAIDAEAPPPAATPTRRRRTTRRTTATAAASEEAAPTAAASDVAPTPEAPAEPAAAAEPAATEAEATEEAPARRPRRVASAARGRTRTVR